MGAVAGHCGDSPWAPSCAAGMSPYIYIYIYLFISKSNLIACEGIQFLTDRYKDPFLSSVHGGSDMVPWAHWRELWVNVDRLDV